MRNRRSILLLLLGIAVLVVADLLLRRDGNVRSVTSRETLVDPSHRPESLTIVRRDRPPIVLERRDSWRILAPFSGSADEQAVLRLLDALSTAPLMDCLTDAELLKFGRTRRDFELDPPRATVTLAGAGARATVSLGCLTPAGAGQYVSVGGVDAVYVVPTGVTAMVGLDVMSFRRRSLFAFGAESVSAFDIKRGAGAILTIMRNGAGWKAGAERASDSLVRGFLDRLTAAQAEEFVWPTGQTNEAGHVTSALLASYGLEPESAVTVTLKGLDGADRQVSFGKEAGDRQVYALIQNGGAIAKVPAVLKDLAAQDPLRFTDSRLFPVEASSVSSMTLSEGGVAYSLSRGEGGVWRLESPIVAPADGAFVETLLAKVLALSPADADPTGVSVSLSAGSAPVLVSRRSLLDGDGFASLRSREILKIDPVLVRRIVRTLGGDTSNAVSVVYARERRQWNVESPTGGASADEAAVERVLAALNPLTAERVVRLRAQASELAGFGLETPSLVLAVDQDREDVVRRNLLIGGKCAGGRYATVGSADAVFVVSEAVLTKLSGALLKR